MFHKVLLLNPPYRGSRVKIVFCVGLGYISEALEQAGIEHDVFDMSGGLTFQDLQEKIVADQPDMIGVSMMTYRYKDTYVLLQQIKAVFPEIKIAVGGAHISLLRDQVLKDCDAIDFGILLEGEEIICQLCQGQEPGSVQGLLYRDQAGQVQYSGDRPFIKDLDSKPFPKYKKFDLEAAFNKEINALPIVSSRGCPYACTYCPVKFAIGRHFRARSAQHIIAEIKYWYERGYRRFSFADDNFTLLKDRVYEICDEIECQQLSGLFLSCDNGIRADRVDYDMLKRMREVGFFRIAFGVEAGNDKVLKLLKKSESIDTIKQRIAEACELDYEVDLFFLVGAPGETWEDLQDSFRIAQEYPIGAAYFYNIIPFPNTELFQWIKENGRFLEEPSEYLDYYPILDLKPVFETKEMPLAVRKRALKKAFDISRKTIRCSWERRLNKPVWIAKPLAFIYTSALMQDVILKNVFCKKILYKFANQIIS